MFAGRRNSGVGVTASTSQRAADWRVLPTFDAWLTSFERLSFLAVPRTELRLPSIVLTTKATRPAVTAFLDTAAPSSGRSGAAQGERYAQHHC
jgi:hypothetical protein